MKFTFLSIAAFFSMMIFANAAINIDEEAFGKPLGGWTKRDKRASEYILSGTTYRTYKPEISPTPEGGIFVSVRIDHVRGWLSTDDYAILEITLSAKGTIVSAQSNIAIQGRSISSDVIRGVNDAGQQVVGADRAVQIGTDLVADLSAKLLREKIVEAGRVSFPAAVRHNFNQLYQAVRVTDVPAPPVSPIAIPSPADTPQVPAPEKPKDAPPVDPASNPKSLDIKPYGTPQSNDLAPKH